MLEVKDLSFSYGRNDIFKNISLTFQEGQIYGLLGENGVGKTTLLKILAGLQPAKKGSCKIDGINTYMRTPKILEELYYLPENCLSSNLCIEDYMKNISKFYPNADYNQFLVLLKEFNLKPAAKMNKLSLGQNKKAQIAIALSLNTKYLFLDEPSNGLDIPSKTALCKAIARNCTDRNTIVISTHQVKDLENLINPIIIIDNDNLLLNASLDEISQKLFFCLTPKPVEGNLYCEQTLSGYLNVCVNTDNKESNVNIEALFNAVSQNRELIMNLFKK